MVVHESVEDEAGAARVNEPVASIKVGGKERSDIDACAVWDRPGRPGGLLVRPMAYVEYACERESRMRVAW